MLSLRFKDLYFLHYFLDFDVKRKKDKRNLSYLRRKQNNNLSLNCGSKKNNHMIFKELHYLIKAGTSLKVLCYRSLAVEGTKIKAFKGWKVTGFL